MNEVLKAIKERRSIRKYKSDMLPKEIIDQVIESGLYAASYSAQSNLDGCYGLVMIFNINGNSIKSGRTTRDLSNATRLLYGEECIFSGKYHKGHRDK